MIVGTQETGEARNGPLPSGLGTQEGTDCTGSVGRACHKATLLLSQPHPFDAVTPLVGCGLSPTKPSRVAAASSRWPPQEGTGSSEKVRSDSPKRRASLARLGMSVGVAPARA